MKSLIEIKNIVQVSMFKFLNIYDVHYLNKKGNPSFWRVASHKNYEDYRASLMHEKPAKSDSVIIVAYNEEKDALVMIREFRIPINDYIISFPAGLINPEEDVFASAVREFKEETGLELYEIDYANSCELSFPSVGISDAAMAVVYGKARGEVSSEFLEESEIIEPLYITREKALAILQSKECIDLKAWFVLREFVGENAFRK